MENTAIPELLEKRDQRSGCDNRCHGNADSRSREDPFKRGDYVLALKGKPRGALREDVSLYLNDAEIKKNCVRRGKY